MGVVYSNNYGAGLHSTGTDPFGIEVDASLDEDEAGFSWEDEGINPVFCDVDSSDKAALKSSALISQAVFDIVAAVRLDWWGVWIGLSAEKQKLCRELCRWHWGQT